MTEPVREDLMACLGATTKATRLLHEHAQECRACGVTVADDFVSHPFFGFRADCTRAPLQSNGGER